MFLRKKCIALFCAVGVLACAIPQTFATGLNVPISNPNAETGTFTGWTTSADDEDWSILSSGAHGGTNAFQTGNESSSMYQYIDLIDLGYTAEQISSYDSFEFSVWVKKTDDSPGTGDQYYLGLAERGYGFGAIATTGTPLTTAPSDWEEITIGLGNYGADLRYIHVEVGGYDETEGAGKKGPAFDDMTLTMHGDSEEPVVISLSPSDNAANVSTNPTFTITFDQNVYEGTGNIEIYRTANDRIEETIDIASDNVSGFGTNTLTISPNNILSRNTPYYITIDSTAVLDAWGNAYAGIITSSDWNMQTRKPNDSQEENLRDYTINTVTGDVSDTGKVTLTWNAGGDVSLIHISATLQETEQIYYSGIIPTTETWAWNIPEEYQGKEITFTVTSTDLATDLARATSAAITWNTINTTEEQEEEHSERTNPTHATGTFVKTEDAPTVYYIDAQGYRRPVPDAQTFFTWENSFSVIQTISQAELANIPLGKTLLPKPGTILVKIQSVPKVFAIEGTAEEPVFRWIPSESVATQLYGVQWAHAVIDIPPTLWAHLLFGDEMTVRDAPQTQTLFHREDLQQEPIF